MIWLLLGLLLFGGAAADLSQPHARALVVQQHVGDVVTDGARRDAAQAVADRIVTEAALAGPLAGRFAKRLRELDAEPDASDADYRGLLEATLDAIDGVEQRLVDLRMELRGEMSAAEWTALMAPIRSTD